MSDSLEQARQHLLAPAELDEAQLEKIIACINVDGLDGGDIYFQNVSHESWVLEDSIIKSGDFGVDQGVSIRAISGEKTGFACSDEISFGMLSDMSKTASSIVKAGQQNAVRLKSQTDVARLYSPSNPMNMNSEEKIAILREIDSCARGADERVEQVTASLNSTYGIILVAHRSGLVSTDIRPLTRLSVSAIVKQGDRREQGSVGAGGRYTYSTLIENGAPSALAADAVRQALVNLDARDAPAGEMTVVLGPGWPGVLLHEAVGHGLEGDFNRKKTSAFAGLMGTRVASPGVTVVDNGAMKDRRGSLSIDDEGTPTQCTTLIEDGILKGFMQDKLNASLMGEKSTGNGRRQSYAHNTMPRMTNTYMLAGEHDPKSIIESVDKGVFAVNFGGGQVDITSGKFVFSMSEAYLIENGKLTSPVKGASLIGNGPDVLTRISMIGNDLKLDDGIGSCGKHGQLIPVGVGQPTLRLDGITVGGTGHS